MYVRGNNLQLLMMSEQQETMTVALKGGGRKWERWTGTMMVVGVRRVVGGRK